MTGSEAHIIQEVLAGNSRLFALLVDRHKDKAFTLALRIIGNVEEAEEIVQDAFVRAYKGLVSFRGDARFGTWLFRIVYNLSLSRVARRKEQVISFDDGQSYEHEGDDDVEMGVADMIDQQEMQELVKAEVLKMPAQYRAILTMFYLEEMTYEEMSSVIDKPLGTVKVQLFRGRNLLRRRVLSRVGKEMIE
jgi:RNA polymerase sigma-70 factor, ECF subfamily